MSQEIVKPLKIKAFSNRNGLDKIRPNRTNSKALLIKMDKIFSADRADLFPGKCILQFGLT
jgi:hypothetical protein